MSHELFEIPFELLHYNDDHPKLMSTTDAYFAGELDTVITPLNDLAREGNITAIFRLANVLSNIGEIDQAKYFWRIALAGGHTAAANNLANQLKHEGKKQEAMKLYEISAKAGESDGLFNLGLLVEEDDPAAAEKYFLEAVQAGHPKACANLALICFAAERVNEAFYFAELGISRNDFFSAMALALHYQKLEDWEKTLDACRRSISLSSSEDTPYSIHAYDLIALALLQLNRLDEATTAIEECRIRGSQQYLGLIELQEALNLAANMNSTKFCSNCTSNVTRTAKFCSQCGSRF